MEAVAIIWYLLRVVLIWPATVISIALSVFGIVYRVPQRLILATVFILPNTYFLWDSGHFSAAVSLPFFPLGAAVAVHRQKMLIAWLLFLSYAAFFGWLLLETIR